MQGPEEHSRGLSEQEIKLYRQYDHIHIKAQIKWVNKQKTTEEKFARILSLVTFEQWKFYFFSIFPELSILFMLFHKWQK